MTNNYFNVRCIEAEQKQIVNDIENSRKEQNISDTILNGVNSSTVEKCRKDECKITYDQPMEVDKPNNKAKEKSDGPSIEKSAQVSQPSEETICCLSLLKSKGPLLTKNQLDNLYIEMEDFTKALKSVQPSAKREGFATVPDVTWDDIGSLRDVRAELERSIMVRNEKQDTTLVMLVFYQNPTDCLL